MLMPLSEGPGGYGAKKQAEWPEMVDAVLNPKLLILAVALFGAGCMTNDNATDLIGTAAVPVPVTEIAGNHCDLRRHDARGVGRRQGIQRLRALPRLNFARVNVTVPKVAQDRPDRAQQAAASPTIR